MEGVLRTLSEESLSASLWKTRWKGWGDAEEGSGGQNFIFSMCVPMCLLWKPDADLRGFLYSLHPIFWDRAWIWSSLISQTGQSVNPGSACLCLLLLGLQVLIATPNFLCEFCRLNSRLHAGARTLPTEPYPLDLWIFHIYCPLIG